MPFVDELHEAGHVRGLDPFGGWLPERTALMTLSPSFMIIPPFVDAVLIVFCRYTPSPMIMPRFHNSHCRSPMKTGSRPSGHCTLSDTSPVCQTVRCLPCP